METMKSPERNMLFIFIAIMLAVQLIGGMFTHISVNEWYPTLIKPSWTPPSWVFGVVWTVLYILMAVALWLVWKRKRGDSWFSTPYLFFGLQLLLNLLWSAFFFGLRSPFLALIDIGFLWIAVLGTIIAFSNVYWVAGLLLLPYLIWVTYAAALNFSIWWLNFL